MPNVETYNPEALAQALTELAHHAEATRDAFAMGDELEAYKAFSEAISALARATRQIHLRNREIVLS